MGFVVPLATCELQLDNTKKGLLISSFYLGLIITGHFWGFLTDSLGRRKVALYCITIHLIFSVLTALSLNIWTILTFRVLSGCA